MNRAASVSVVRPLPAWLRHRYLIAGAAALLVAPSVWLVRNVVSDRAFYNSTRRLRTEQAYQAYLKAGWLNVAAIRQELPRVALDEALRKRSTDALRQFLSRYPGSSVDAEARATLDAHYRSILEAERPSAVEPVQVDELLDILGRMDHSKVHAAVLAAFIPARKAAKCGKDWRERLPGEATPVKGLLVRALLRGNCERFLQEAIEDKSLFNSYRTAIEAELATPAVTTALALRQMQDYQTVQANPRLFSPGVGPQVLDAIRKSSWVPDGVPPSTDQIGILKRTLAENVALAQATLDYMERPAERWLAPTTDITKDAAVRTQMALLLEFSQQVSNLGRAALSANIARPAESAFRVEIDAVEKKGTSEMVRFLTSDNANPLAGELMTRLIDAGVEVLVYSFAGEGGARFAHTIQERLAEVSSSSQIVVQCSGAPCEKLPRRVKVRLSESTNVYCYDKFYTGFGKCSNPGKHMTLTLSYFSGNRQVGADSISAETPDVVKYRSPVGLDTGPSSWDVDSATVDVLNTRLKTARLSMPF